MTFLKLTKVCDIPSNIHLIFSQSHTWDSKDTKSLLVQLNRSGSDHSSVLEQFLLASPKSNIIHLKIISNKNRLPKKPCWQKVKGVKWISINYDKDLMGWSSYPQPHTDSLGPLSHGHSQWMWWPPTTWSCETDGDTYCWWLEEETISIWMDMYTMTFPICSHPNLYSHFYCLY